MRIDAVSSEEPSAMPRISPILALSLLLPLAACASPCDRIDRDFRQLNADAVREPAMVVDGRYIARFQELTAQRIEYQCPP